jgi:hypothetical protein
MFAGLTAYAIAQTNIKKPGVEGDARPAPARDSTPRNTQKEPPINETTADSTAPVDTKRLINTLVKKGQEIGVSVEIQRPWLPGGMAAT